MPDKKSNEIVTNIIFPIIVIGGLIIGIFFSDRLTFIPDLSFCASNPILLCDIPILGRIVKILDTRFIGGLLVYIGIFALAFFILRTLGFKVVDEKESEKSIKKETKKEREATKKFQIKIFFLTLFVGLAWLIIFQ